MLVWIREKVGISRSWFSSLNFIVFSSLESFVIRGYERFFSWWGLEESVRVDKFDVFGVRNKMRFFFSNIIEV